MRSLVVIGALVLAVRLCVWAVCDRGRIRVRVRVRNSSMAGVVMPAVVLIVLIVVIFQGGTR